MRALMALLALAVFGAVPAAAADPLAEARRLYNVGQYETAARYAREALKVPATAESARVVLGRIYLERFRRSADEFDLTEARNSLKMANIEALEPHERVELVIGQAQCLFLEERYSTSSEAFERALDISRTLGPAAHERVLDWWASSLDSLARSRPRESRESFYLRIVVRMEKELALDPASAPAAYWLAAGLRGSGNLDRAWSAASAGWVTATQGRDFGAALRADLDLLMIQGIIPERAARLQPKDSRQASGVMLAEWEALKAAWGR